MYYKVLFALNGGMKPETIMFIYRNMQEMYIYDPIPTRTNTVVQ